MFLFSTPGASLATRAGRMRPPLSDERGFSLMELLVIAGIIGVMAGVAVGVTSTVVRMARGESGAQQLDAFLKRHREMAIARRRDIEIRFIEPNRVESLERDIPDENGDMDPSVPLEEMVFEGGIEYEVSPDVPDTPNRFGNGAPITLVGAIPPVMFSSEGAFIDARNNPINASIFLAVPNDPLSGTAVTILGPTATIERWLWNGGAWTK